MGFKIVKARSPRRSSLSLSCSARSRTWAGTSTVLSAASGLKFTTQFAKQRPQALVEGGQKFSSTHNAGNSIEAFSRSATQEPWSKSSITSSTRFTSLAISCSPLERAFWNCSSSVFKNAHHAVKIFSSNILVISAVKWPSIPSFRPWRIARRMSFRNLNLGHCWKVLQRARHPKCRSQHWIWSAITFTVRELCLARSEYVPKLAQKLGLKTAARLALQNSEYALKAHPSIYILLIARGEAAIFILLYCMNTLFQISTTAFCHPKAGCPSAHPNQEVVVKISVSGPTRASDSSRTHQFSFYCKKDALILPRFCLMSTEQNQGIPTFEQLLHLRVHRHHLQNGNGQTLWVHA